MNEIYVKYLSILRAFVQQTAPEAVDAKTLEQIMALADINSTGGIVCWMYRKYPDRTPSELLPLLRQRCLSEVAVFTRRAEQMKRLLARFDREGIHCLLFKGFIVRNYYPVPELRTFSDIDFVIRKEDRQKSDELMKALGYEPRDTWEPAYSYLKGTEYYEIHTDVMEIDVSDKADYRAYYSRIWEHTRPSETVKLPHVLEFTPEFHFLYLLTHVAKHISSAGAGIRMYLDIALFIRHFGNSLDWEWVAGELKKLCFEDFANLVLTVAEEWFGVISPLPCRPVPAQVMADFLEFTMEGGVYGKVGRDESVVFLKQQGRNEEEVSKFKTLLYHAFPPAQVMENRYTYLQKRPWLLPAAWVHRLAASHREWGRFADHTKNILTADEEDALRLKRLYKEIGL